MRKTAVARRAGTTRPKPAPRGKARAKKIVRWRERMVVIDIGGGVSTRRVRGWATTALPGLAVTPSTRDESRWVVTHLRSGMRIGRSEPDLPYDSDLPTAKAIARAVRRLYPWTKRADEILRIAGTTPKSVADAIRRVYRKRAA